MCQHRKGKWNTPRAHCTDSPASCAQAPAPLPINRPRSAVTQFKRSHNTTALSVQTLGDLTPILVPKKQAMQLTTQVGKQKGQLRVGLRPRSGTFTSSRQKQVLPKTRLPTKLPLKEAADRDMALGTSSTTPAGCWLSPDSSPSRVSNTLGLNLP